MWAHTHISGLPSTCCATHTNPDHAGEQRTRQYNWSSAAIEPSTHRFGAVDTRGQQASVKQILQPDLDDAGGALAAPPAASPVYAAHKATLGDTLG